MRLPMLVAFLVAPLFAQTAPPPAAEQKSAEQELTVQAPQAEPVIPVNLTPVRMQEPSGVCAIPLKNVLHLDPHDKIAVTPPPTQNMRSPKVILPAPPCDDKKR
jgi:hypothetical protein